MKTVGNRAIRGLMIAAIVAGIAGMTLLLEHRVFRGGRGLGWNRTGAEADALPHIFPGSVSPASSTGPMDARAAEAQARAVIDEEMSDASPEEREIWLAELKQQPPDVIREILSLRRQLNSSPDRPPVPKDPAHQEADLSDPFPERTRD